MICKPLNALYFSHIPLIVVPAHCTVIAPTGATMAVTTHLKKRGETWYARLAVPRSLKEKVGRSEYLRSLRTSSVTEANRLKHAALAQLQKEMERDVQMALAPAGSLEGVEAYASQLHEAVTEGEIDPEQAHDQIDLAVDTYLQHQTRVWGADPETGHPRLPEEAVEAVRRVFRRAKGEQIDLLTGAIEAHLGELKAAGRREQTLSEKRRQLTEFRAWLKGDPEVATIDRATAVRYLEGNLLKRGHSRKTTQDILGNLSAFFNWLFKRGRVPANPFLGLTGSLPKVTRGVAPKRDKWTPEELSALLVGKDALPRSDPLWAMATIALYSGMRVEEIADMQLSNVHADRLRIAEGKTEAAVRDVPLHPVIAPLIAKLKEASDDGYLIPGLLSAGRDNKRGKLISKRFGYAIHGQRKFRSALKFHTLRNTFISKCEVLGLPEPTVKQIVGHERKSLTYGHYSGRLPVEELHRAIRRVTYGALDGEIAKYTGEVEITVRARARR